MTNIWNRNDIPDDEIVKLFTRELNSLKRLRDSLIKPGERINANNVKKENASEEENASERDISKQTEPQIDEILGVLPKSLRKEVNQILRFIKSKPDKLSWSANKEIIYDGTVLHGSNIGDLLMDTLSNRKKMICPALFRSTFSKGLMNIGLPKEWIKNHNMQYEIQGKENLTSSPVKRTPSASHQKKTDKNVRSPMKWLCSTSRIR